jgi:hypothetical protein
MAAEAGEYGYSGSCLPLAPVEWESSSVFFKEIANTPPVLQALVNVPEVSSYHNNDPTSVMVGGLDLNML